MTSSSGGKFGLLNAQIFLKNQCFECLSFYASRFSFLYILYLWLRCLSGEYFGLIGLFPGKFWGKKNGKKVDQIAQILPLTTVKA